MKKFANQEKSRTFVSGMRKQGSLDGIILLVISFRVLKSVVSRASACEGRRFFFMCTPVHIKKKIFPRASRCPQGLVVGKEDGVVCVRRRGAPSRKTPFSATRFTQAPPTIYCVICCANNLYLAGPSPCPCPGVDTPPGGYSLPPDRHIKI